MEDFRTSGGERARQIETDLRSIEKEAPDPYTKTLADLGIWPPPPPPTSMVLAVLDTTLFRLAPKHGLLCVEP